MPNPASYTPTTWVNGTTAAQASTMNNIETGLTNLYANTPQTGGANTFTAAQTEQVTLSSSDRVVHTWKATDGKQFSWYIRSNNHVALHNDTDGIWLQDINPLIGPLANIICSPTNPDTTYGAGNVPAGTAWIKDA